MKEDLQQLQEKAISELQHVQSSTELQDWRVLYLGKKGELTSFMKQMGQLPAEDRPKAGQWVNEVRQSLEQAYQQREEAIKSAELEKRLASQTIDITLPGRPIQAGGEHPLTRTIREMEDIFLHMGFEIAEGTEVENDYYNFEALNLPQNHPARDMQDTFYLSDEFLLRTHTSAVQIRTMERKKGAVPVRMISAGKVYRRDDDDATHSHQFTQMEGLVVDKGIRMSDLKGILLSFAKEMFGPAQQVRLRPSYFPFTEPSAEVDISCVMCGGDGCRVCKHTGWIEILGCGMVHPRVLELAGYDSEANTGFAFGMGVERIAMLKYGVDDIRHFYTNDVRFLQQFHTRTLS